MSDQSCKNQPCFDGPLPAASKGHPLETKALPILEPSLDTTEKGHYFTGYAAIYGQIDRDNDRLAAGVFKASLARMGLPRLLWQHDPTDPIGRFTLVEDREKGLYVEAELSSSGRGHEAYELIKLKALEGLSVGFMTRQASHDPATGVRTIYQADLAEISIVTFPANDAAKIETVKSIDNTYSRPEFLQTKTAFERFLRRQGVSRNDAKLLIAKGHTGMIKAPEDQILINQLAHSLRASSGQFTKSDTFKKS